MRNPTYLILLVLMIYSINTANAQVPDRPQKNRANQSTQSSQPAKVNLNTSSGDSYNNERLPGTKGSAYLNPEFIEGVISFKDGNRMEGMPMRFNLYTQQMQFVENDDTLALGNPKEIEYIRIADKVFVYTDYLQQGEHKSGYFELLENGKCRLLKRWAALYHEVDENDNTGDETFYRDCHCYLQFFMNPASPVISKRKQFATSFASNGDEVLSYMKDENLKPRNDEDLIKIIEFYNGLQ